MVFSAGRGRPGEPFARLDWHTLDDGDVTRGGDGAGQPEAVGGEEPPVLRLGPLQAPDEEW